MQFSHDTRYLYAVGRIRALESRLLTDLKVGRLLESNSASGVLKLLSEYNYSRRLGIIQDHPERFDELFEGEIRDLYAELLSLIKDDILVNMFRHRYDLKNIKIIIKLLKFHQEIVVEGSFARGITTCGCVKHEVLIEAIKKRDFKELPGMLNRILSLFFELEQEELTGKMIDVYLDKFYLSLLLDTAYMLKSSFLTGAVKTLIDMYNLTLIFRGIFREESKQEISFALSSGGYLELEILKKMAGWTFSDIVSYIGRTRYDKVAKHMIQRGHEKFLDSIRHSMMGCLLGYAQQANHLIDGYEPVMSYLLKKELELRIVRMIVIGKSHGLSDTVLEEEVTFYHE